MTPIQPAPPAQGAADLREGQILEAQVCIVGAGPGGSTVAYELARAGLDVLVLEEGPRQSDFRPNQAHTARVHMQEAGAMLAKGPTPFLVAAGRGLGGGTLVNSALCFRTPDAILEAWAEQLEEPTWGPEAMAAVFDHVEAATGVSLPASDYAAGEHNLRIAAAAARLGLPGGLARRNTPGCVGCGQCNLGCRVGGKASVNLNFLAMAAERGARLQAELKVQSVDTQGDRVIGVSGRAVDPTTGRLGVHVSVRAEHTVLAAGAVGTPRLLHLCGLADRIPGCGEGLLVHPGSAVLARFPEPVDVFQGATQGVWFEDPALPGVLPHGWASPPEVLAMLLAPHYGGMKQVIPHLRHIGGVLALVSDHGHGSVSAHADGRANIVYDFDPHDIERIQEAMVLCARVLLEAGATELYAVAQGVPPCSDLDSFAGHMRATSIRDFTLYAAHPMCTMRMGQSTNSDGSVRGLERLTVADAGVFPSSLGVNPQLSTMAAGTVIGRALAARA